jgi:hypothetical protein
MAKFAHNRDNVLDIDAMLPESVKQRIIRAEVEAMDWPEVIGE